MNTSRQIGGALGIAVLITLATALTDHLIGHGRVVQQALTDGFRLGYWIAAGLAAAAAVASFALLPKRAGHGAAVRRRVPIAVGLGLVAVCFVGADVAVAGSHGRADRRLHIPRRVQLRIGAGDSSADRAGGRDPDAQCSAGEGLHLHGQLLRPEQSADGGAERTADPRPSGCRPCGSSPYRRTSWQATSACRPTRGDLYSLGGRA